MLSVGAGNATRIKKGGSMADNKKLTFKIHKQDNSGLINPRWRKAEVENAECPSCKNTMVVIFGYKQILYAWCARCQQYYVGEE